MRIRLMSGMLCAALIPVPLFANDAAHPTLLQMTLLFDDRSAAPDLRNILAEESARITSCANAFDMGKRLKDRGIHGSMEVNIRSDVPLAALPAELRASLQSRPIGHATLVFGGGNAWRVLMQCEPGFQVPAKIVPNQQTGKDRQPSDHRDGAATF